MESKNDIKNQLESYIQKLVKELEPGFVEQRKSIVNTWDRKTRDIIFEYMQKFNM